MEAVVVWQHKWSQDLFVPAYLFLGGLAGGLAILAAVADLVSAAIRRLAAPARVAAFTALPALGLAGLLLTAHLGKPERGLGFPLFFTNYESWMTRGGWIVGAAAPLVVAYAALWYFEVRPALRRVVAVVLIPVAALLAMYTGFLLSGAGYVPLWSRRHLPALFLTSGLTAGVAATGLVFLLLKWRAREDAALVRRCAAVALVALIGVELWELRAFTTYLAERAPDKSIAAALAPAGEAAVRTNAAAGSDVAMPAALPPPGGLPAPAALETPGGEIPAPSGDFRAPIGSRLAWMYLTGGDGFPGRLLESGAPEIRAGGQVRPTLAPWFWIGVVGLGLATPLLLTVVELVSDLLWAPLAHLVAVAKFALVLAGGFLLRVVIVWGGDLKAPLPFPPQLFQLPGFGG